MRAGHRSSSVHASGRLRALLTGLVPGLVLLAAAAGLPGCGISKGSEALGQSWTVDRSPSPLPTSVSGYDGTQADALSSVSCVSQSQCVAVGSWAKNGTDFNHPLLLGYGGAGWTTLRTSEASGGLYSVSCPSPEECLAVGSDSVIRIGGSAAHRMPWPPGLQGLLAGISCPSVSDCWAVGYGPHASHSFSRARPDHLVLLHFDGASWQQTEPPSLPTAMPSTLLFGVSCFDPSFCVAVGEAARSASSAQDMIVLSYDGLEWSAALTPTLSHGSQAWLKSVACMSTQRCVAVGSASTSTASAASPIDRTLVIAYDGSAWKVARSPDPLGGSGNDDLSGVACTSPTSCIAVGALTSASGEQRNLVLRFDGASWSAEPVPDSGGHDALGDPYFLGCGGSTCWDNSLSGIACIQATTCFAVGSMAYQSDQSDQSTVPTVRTLVLRSTVRP